MEGLARQPRHVPWGHADLGHVREQEEQRAESRERSLCSVISALYTKQPYPNGRYEQEYIDTTFLCKIIASVVNLSYTRPLPVHNPTLPWQTWLVTTCLRTPRPLSPYRSWTYCEFTACTITGHVEVSPDTPHNSQAFDTLHFDLALARTQISTYEHQLKNSNRKSKRQAPVDPNAQFVTVAAIVDAQARIERRYGEVQPSRSSRRARDDDNQVFDKIALRLAQIQAFLELNIDQMEELVDESDWVITRLSHYVGGGFSRPTEPSLYSEGQSTSHRS